MLDQINPALAQATDHAYSIPLDQVGDGWPERFRADTFWPYFDRLRKEDKGERVWAVLVGDEV